MATILKNASHHFLEYCYASFEPTVLTNMFFYAFSIGHFVNNGNQKIGHEPHYMPFLTLPDYKMALTFDLDLQLMI